ncbi:GlsB/YeaQ/YmgE family stress response membrane protein [Tsukamurella serpentis]
MTLSLSIIGWIVFGAIAGWLASNLTNTDAQQGLVLNIFVGVVGGVLGGFVLHLFGVETTSGRWVFSFLTCLAGACTLLFIVTRIAGGPWPRSEPQTISEHTTRRE